MLSVNNLKIRTTLWSIFALGICYLVFELIAIPHIMLSPDELFFLHHIFKFTNQVPYRDFLPYKTILGYYFLSIPMFFSKTEVVLFDYIRYELALVNTFCIIALGMWANRFFQIKAILLSLGFIIAGQLFLMYSVDIRVDMLTSWLGLCSVMFILSERIKIAGVMLALSFMVSQKALWFWIASNVGLGMLWLIAYRDIKNLKKMVIFNSAVIIPIVIYCVLWSLTSSFSVVWKSVFYEGYIQSKLSWYSKDYYRFWQFILACGSITLLIWPMTWISLVDKKINFQRLFIITYTATMMGLILSYQQAFPYNVAFAVPAYFLIYADFFSWFFSLNSTRVLTLIAPRKLFWFFSAWFCFAIAMFFTFGLPGYCSLVLVVPGCLWMMFYSANELVHNVCRNLIIWTCIIIGVIFPLLTYILKNYNVDSGYQKAVVNVANQLLEKNENYIAGTALLFNHEQNVAGLQNLIGPAIYYLYTQSAKIAPILIASLDMSPVTQQVVLNDLKNKPVKFYVNNYRIGNLPYSIRHYLGLHYQHYWGSIYLYAPVVSSGKHEFTIKFEGNYRVTSKSNIYINKKLIHPNSMIQLTFGKHQSDSTEQYRLSWVPPFKVIGLLPKYQDDTWANLMKSGIL